VFEESLEYRPEGPDERIWKCRSAWPVHKKTTLSGAIGVAEGGTKATEIADR
jgi:hypothetical protein